MVCLLGCKINSLFHQRGKKKSLEKQQINIWGIKSKKCERWNDGDEEGIFGLNLVERIEFPTQYNTSPDVGLYNLVRLGVAWGKPTVFWGSNGISVLPAKLFTVWFLDFQLALLRVATHPGEVSPHPVLELKADRLATVNAKEEPGWASA